MTTPERLSLHRRLGEVLGPEHAEVLMANLPPFDWHQLATKADLAELRTELRAEFTGFRTELRAELREMETRLERVLDERLTARFEATLHRELRTMAFVMGGTTIGSILATGAVVLAAVSLA